MPEVRRANGDRIDWTNPPSGPTKCSLVIDGGKRIAGFRTLCHINLTDYRARKTFNTGLTIIQPPYNTSVAASAGTHDFDAVWDVWINGVPAWDQQRFLRANGWGAWYRHPPLFGQHQHMFTLPPHRGDPASDDFKQAGMTVGKFIDGGLSLLGHTIGSSQIDDFYHHAFGLAGQHTPGSDKSWFPPDIAATAFGLSAYIQQRANKAKAAG